MKALFLPVNSIQAHLYQAVSKELDELGVFPFITDLDRRINPHYLVAPVLQESSLSFRHIKDYPSEDPKAILQKEAPNIVIVSQDTMDEVIRLFMQVAKRQNIPVLVVQDGFFFRGGSFYMAYSPYAVRTPTLKQKVRVLAKFTPKILGLARARFPLKVKFRIALMRFMDVVRNRPRLWGHGDYTKIAVTGDYVKEVLISEGIDPSKIVVTGEPRWDELISLETNPTEVFDDLRLDKNKKLILLTTVPIVEGGMWSEEERTFWLSSILRAADAIPGAQLVIKLHPRDHGEAYESILRQEKRCESCVMTQDFAIFKLLEACDILITHYCTTALEAILVDKPVITVDYKVDPCEVPYVAEGASLGVHRPEELVPAIEKALYDQLTRGQLREARERFVCHHAYLQDRQASKRVADLIIQMIEESRGKKEKI